MAKQQQDKPKPTGGVRKVKWREGEVFACGAPGCGYAHERQDRAEAHVAEGRHQKAPTPPSSGPEPVVEAPDGGEAGEAVEARTGGDS